MKRCLCVLMLLALLPLAACGQAKPAALPSATTTTTPTATTTTAVATTTTQTAMTTTAAATTATTTTRATTTVRTTTTTVRATTTTIPVTTRTTPPPPDRGALCGDNRDGQRRAQRAGHLRRGQHHEKRVLAA